MTTMNKGTPNGAKQSQDDSLVLWYQSLKKQNSVAANSALASMDIIHRLYGKSPATIAKMNPEEAYRFVLDMIKRMQDDGRSFSHIDTIVKSVNDWLKFNDVKATQNMEVSKEAVNSARFGATALSKEPTWTKKRFTLSSLFSNDQVLMLREESEEALKAHGSNLITKIRHLESVLSTFDPSTDSVITSIDTMVNKGVDMDIGAYYLAAYSSERDLDKAVEVYRITKSLMRYIALMDDFYESGNKENLDRAHQLLDEVTFDPRAQLSYSVRLAVDKFWPFWMFENMTKHRILEGEAFSDKELRYFILFKSSDTPLIYCSVLNCYLETFNPNIAMVFHYNQALIDILDDYIDIEEDVRTQMPNIFRLASGDFSPSHIESSPENTQQILTETSAKNRILSVVEWIEQCLADISLPADYGFLKDITGDHLLRIRSILQ